MSPAGRIRGGIGADEEYWSALERGEFRMPRCSGCGRWMWPAHFRCGPCGSWEMAWETVKPCGVIYTWTRNHALSDVIGERRPDLPFVTLLVELPQAGGVRIPGVLIGEAPAIGARVEGVIRPPETRAKGYATMAWRIAGVGA